MSPISKRLASLSMTGIAAFALAVPALVLPSPISLAATSRTDVIVAAAPVSAAPPLAAKVRKLSASVGPSFDISMSRSRTRPGMYDITVRDLSSAHNFHLTGPGVDKKTRVAQTVTRVWHVRLRVGTYRFQCDIHPNLMFGSIRVVAPPR